MLDRVLWSRYLFIERVGSLLEAASLNSYCHESYLPKCNVLLEALSIGLGRLRENPLWAVTLTT